MTGTHTHDRIVSRLTLAVLEDTGWYEPNYDMADPLSWGKGLGCDFVNKSCKYWMDTQKSRYGWCLQIKCLCCNSKNNLST